MKNDLKKGESYSNEIQNMIERSKTEKIRNFYTLPDENFILSSSRNMHARSRTERKPPQEY